MAVSDVGRHAGWDEGAQVQGRLRMIDTTEWTPVVLVVHGGGLRVRRPRSSLCPVLLDWNCLLGLSAGLGKLTPASTGTRPVRPCSRTAMTSTSGGHAPPTSGSVSTTQAPATNAPTTSGPTTLPTTTDTSPPSTVPTLGCEAAGLPDSPADQDLPAAVSEVRAAIVEAATSCDMDRLAGLTSVDFTCSFGDGGDPAGFWSKAETDSAATGTVSPLALLVRVLDVPYGAVDTGDGSTICVWPSAHAYSTWEETPQADREALLMVYGAEDPVDFERSGGYLGYRVGIRDSGEWVFFVAGD